jgi:hypothetical protein
VENKRDVELIGVFCFVFEGELNRNIKLIFLSSSSLIRQLFAYTDVTKLFPASSLSRSYILL